jgi:thiol-disulfide isomerase/thioredoxin
LKIRQLLALLALSATIPALAQGPTDASLHDFEPDGEYEFQIDGKAVPGAEVARANHLPAYLIVSKSLPAPVLVLPRENVAKTVPAAALVRRADGLIDVAAGAQITPIGPLTIAGDGASFSQGGKTLSLRAKAPLTGLHTAADVETFNVAFRRRADRYVPNADAVKMLREVKRHVVVHVVFGSWCPHCQAKLPFLLRAERELHGTPIQIEYYGLPRPPAAWTDPEAVRLGVSSLPTAIVSIDGQEVGRIPSSSWDAPENMLARILTASTAAR